MKRQQKLELSSRPSCGAVALWLSLSLLAGCGQSAPRLTTPALPVRLVSESPAPPRPTRELAPGVYELTGAMPGPDDEDLEALDGLLAGREVVALGETVHGINTFAQLRSRAIRFLVEKRGYRAISFEGPWFAAERTRAYLEHGQGTLDDAMRGLTFLAWGNRPTVELVVWLRAFNQAHPDDPVRFFGADPQQPADDAVLLRRLLGAERTEGLEACVCGAFDSTAACYRDPVESAIIAGQRGLC